MTTASGGCVILWIEKMTVKCKQWLTFTQEFELVIVDCDKKLGYLGRKTVCSYKLTFNDEKTVDNKG